jgi:glutamate-5-semialdehyde dehydrogenase
MATKNKRKPPRKAVPAVDYREELVQACVQAKAASRALASASAESRNRALEEMAEALVESKADILFKNEIDVEAGRKAGLSAALLDRLKLDEKRVDGMAKGLREMAALPDPLGKVIESRSRADGLKIDKVRVPLGVVAMVYEARPNVTVDSAGLCLKSGNAVVLRGGKEAFNSNTALVHILQTALTGAGLPAACVQLVGTTDRAAVRDLVRMDKWIDLAIPRGGEEMVNAIREMATVPVLSHGKGLCAVYVDKAADLAMAENVAFNAKVQRPGVCNAMETLLVHKDVAKDFLPRIAKKYAAAGVEVRADAAAKKLAPSAKPAREQDWDTEFLGLTVAVKVVPSLDDAIGHINLHGSHHSDSIVTRDGAAADRFLREVDSAAVLHNASTRLHDGGVFGLGAEMGISTQKLHARGTMGLKELTTTKYVVRGQGHIRE